MISKKNIIYINLFAFINNLNSTTYENYQLYKDISIIKMGGANIGLGGSGTAVFYNPAGLSTINRSNGAEIKLINLSLSANKNVINIGKDGLDLQDIENEDERNLELLRITREYLGSNNNFEISNFSYVAKGIKNLAFSIGALTNINLNFSTHRGLGSNGFFDVDGSVIGGGVFGISYDWSQALSFGIATKYIKYISVHENFTIDKLVEHRDNIDSYLIDDISHRGTSTVFDLGLLWLTKTGYKVGASFLNIGGIGYKNSQSYIPETLNFGLGYEKNLNNKFLKSWKAGLDYIDITNNSDFITKSRIGVEGLFYDSTMLTLKGGLGFYQGNYTAGLDMRFAIVQLSLVTYTEELGAYSGQDSDRRYLFNLTIGW